MQTLKREVNRDTYILKAPVEHLELSFVKVCLSLQLFEALRSMADHGHLQVIVDFVCRSTEKRNI